MNPGPQAPLIAIVVMVLVAIGEGADRHRKNEDFLIRAGRSWNYPSLLQDEATFLYNNDDKRDSSSVDDTFDFLNRNGKRTQEAYDFLYRGRRGNNAFDLLARNGKKKRGDTTFDFLGRNGKRSGNNAFDFLGRNGKRSDAFDFLGRNGKRSAGADFDDLDSYFVKKSNSDAFDFLGRNGKRSADTAFDFLGRNGKRSAFQPDEE